MMERRMSLNSLEALMNQPKPEVSVASIVQRDMPVQKTEKWTKKFFPKKRRKSLNDLMGLDDGFCKSLDEDDTIDTDLGSFKDDIDPEFKGLTGDLILKMLQEDLKKPSSVRSEDTSASGLSLTGCEKSMHQELDTPDEIDAACPNDENRLPESHTQHTRCNGSDECLNQSSSRKKGSLRMSKAAVEAAHETPHSLPRCNTGSDESLNRHSTGKKASRRMSKAVKGRTGQSSTDANNIQRSGGSTESLDKAMEKKKGNFRKSKAANAQNDQTNSSGMKKVSSLTSLGGLIKPRLKSAGSLRDLLGKRSKKPQEDIQGSKANATFEIPVAVEGEHKDSMGSNRKFKSRRAKAKDELGGSSHHSASRRSSRSNLGSPKPSSKKKLNRRASRIGGLSASCHSPNQRSSKHRETIQNSLDALGLDNIGSPKKRDPEKRRVSSNRTNRNRELSSSCHTSRSHTSKRSLTPTKQRSSTRTSRNRELSASCHAPRSQNSQRSLMGSPQHDEQTNLSSSSVSILGSEDALEAKITRRLGRQKEDFQKDAAEGRYEQLEKRYKDLQRQLRVAKQTHIASTDKLKQQVKSLEMENNTLRQNQMIKQSNHELIVGAKDKEIKELGQTVDRILELDRKKAQKDDQIHNDFDAFDASMNSTGTASQSKELMLAKDHINTLQRRINEMGEASRQLEEQVKCQDASIRNSENILRKDNQELQEKLAAKDATIEHLMNQLKTLKLRGKNIDGSNNSRRMRRGLSLNNLIAAAT